MKEAADHYLNYLAKRIHNSRIQWGVFTNLYTFHANTMSNLMNGLLNDISDSPSIEVTQRFLNQTTYQGNIPINTAQLRKRGLYIDENHILLIEKYIVFNQRCLSLLNDNRILDYRAAVLSHQDLLLENTRMAGMNLLQAIAQWAVNFFTKRNHSQQIVEAANEMQLTSL